MSMTSIHVDETSTATVAVTSSEVVSVTHPSTDTQRSDFTRDLLDLTKPRITSMVLVTVAISQFVASGGQLNLWLLLNTLVGTVLVAASSGAFNQWLERDSDAKMERTCDRPLPAGRMRGYEVIALGLVTLTAGLIYLSMTVGWQPMFWAAMTWLVYVCVYTPMKQVSNWNTTVGAVSGALPILIGSSAVGATFDLQIATMFSVLFLWQFPHFIAIAWIYRKQYAKAGLQMVTVSDPSGRKPGIYSVLGALLLLVASLLPLYAGFSSMYAAVALALGIYQALAAWRFQQELSDAAARQLLKASIIYLPLVLGLIAVQTVL